MDAVPNWAVESIGKMVSLNADCEGFPKGHRGLLVSLRTKHQWGVPGVYATVALDLKDLSYEENVELENLLPVESED